MLNAEQITTYFKEVAGSTKFQLSSAVTFGVALLLVWLREGNELKLFLTILFLFPMCMFVCSIVEKIASFFGAKFKKYKSWRNLSPEEAEFISHYVSNNTRTRYMSCFNGTYRDSGIINPLIGKDILYLGSGMSEFRGGNWMSREQQFPINIHDEAFAYFKKLFETEKGKVHHYSPDSEMRSS